jgi:hypothetical protein
MTVATGAAGTTVGGAVLGVSLTRGSDGSMAAGADAAAAAAGSDAGVLGAAAEGMRTLPFTGADHVVTMLVLALVLLVAGLLVTGMAHRYLPQGRHSY